MTWSHSRVAHLNIEEERFASTRRKRTLGKDSLTRPTGRSSCPNTPEGDLIASLEEDFTIASANRWRGLKCLTPEGLVDVEGSQVQALEPLPHFYQRRTSLGQLSADSETGPGFLVTDPARRTTFVRARPGVRPEHNFSS
jgi:hypothetical protein